MSAFKDLVMDDIHNVFLNTDEFAELRTVIYDGVTYSNIPIELNGITVEKRPQVGSDHAQGLYMVTDLAHIARSDIGGNLPERGAKLEISSKINPNYFRPYYVASAQDMEGLLRIELEAIDE